MSNHFPKSLRVRTRRQFQRIAHQSTRYVGQWIIIESRSNKNSLTRLGITASRHYGNAVHRNRFKRIVREAFRLSHQQLQVGFDLNIKPRNTSQTASTKDILNELVRFLGPATSPLSQS